MKLSTTAEYAIKILCVMAKDLEKLHSARELSENLNIPYKYLTKLMTMLSKENIIESKKGREGGFYFCRNIEEIMIIEILEIVGEIGDDLCIMGYGNCNSKNKCLMHDKWAKPKKYIKEAFEKTSLRELIEKDSDF